MVLIWIYVEIWRRQWSQCWFGIIKDWTWLSMQVWTWLSMQVWSSCNWSLPKVLLVFWIRGSGGRALSGHFKKSFSLWYVTFTKKYQSGFSFLSCLSSQTDGQNEKGGQGKNNWNLIELKLMVYLGFILIFRSISHETASPKSPTHPLPRVPAPVR